MNFLELCQFTHRYIGAGNEPPGTAPLDVRNQQGAMFSLVRSVQDAYLDVLNDQTGWTFMQASGAVLLPANVAALGKADIRLQIPDYNALTTMMGDGAQYILMQPGNTKAQDPSLGKAGGLRQVVYVPYQQWRGWKDRPPIPRNTPSFFSVKPDETLVFDAMPTTPMTLTFDYRRSAPKLAENTDVPVFGEEFHSVIAWRAVLLWGGTNEANNKAAFAMSEYNRIMNDMRSRYLPETVFAVGKFYGSPATTA